MRHKIGEIFEYNGEWYQCVKSDGTCKGCVGKFQPYSFCNGFGGCVGKIFKKLEKVGEPFVSGGKLYQHYKVFDIDNIDFNKCTNMNVHNYNKKTLTVEIKQNQEDMEEKYSELTDIVHEYMDKDMTYKDFKEAINDWVDDYVANKESDKPTLKPFDLQQAKDGKPVCTRDGRKVRIISFDREFLYNGQNYCIVALISEAPHNEVVYSYTKDGLYNPGKIHERDLMMLPEKRSGWINIYALNTFYSSKEEAEANIDRDYENEYIGTTEIEWEE